MDETTPRDLQQAPHLQQALPFDDEADRPISFALTARARRQVAPDALPDLRLVDGAMPVTTGADRGRATEPRSADLDRPDDTRPSRARALRRAGVGVTAIARQLDTDELLVRAWIGDVAVHPTATRRGSVGAVDGEARGRADDRERQERLLRIRQAARDDAAGRLRTDPGFAAGLGLLAALAATDEHAATLTTSSLPLAATVQAWLVTHADVRSTDVRVILRLGRDVAGDLARRRWADGLQVPMERIVHTRWHGAPAPAAEEALIRLPGAALAAQVAGWCDAFLDPVQAAPVDATF